MVYLIFFNTAGEMGEELQLNMIRENDMNRAYDIALRLDRRARDLANPDSKRAVDIVIRDIVVLEGKSVRDIRIERGLPEP